MRTNSVFLSSGGGDYLLVKVPNALTSGPYISAGYFSFTVSQQMLLKTFNCIKTFSILLKKWLKMHSLFLKFTKSLGPVFVGLCSPWCWPPWVPCVALGLSRHGWVPQAQLLDIFTWVGLWLLVKEGFPCRHWKRFSASSKIRKYNLKMKSF